MVINARTQRRKEIMLCVFAFIIIVGFAYTKVIISNSLKSSCIDKTTWGKQDVGVTPTEFTNICALRAKIMSPLRSYTVRKPRSGDISVVPKARKEIRTPSG